MKNVTTIAKYKIDLKASDLKNRIVESYLDTMNDYFDSDISDLLSHADSFHQCLNHIKRNEWQSLFSKGYTMMLLDEETMLYVEKFFNSNVDKTKSEKNELELVIEDDINKGLIPHNTYKVNQDCIDY